MTLPAGTRFGAFDIVGLIGAGGMGEVYRARDTRLNRTIAVKVLSSDFTQDADRVRRFEQEAIAASALNHPNILTIFEAGESDGCRFIATELVEGDTLRQLLDRSGRLPVRDALSIVTQIAAALSAAHNAGIVHRDIKPDNVMLRRDGYVKVLDFGIAKLMTPPDGDAITTTDHGGHTRDGAMIGTLPYMSPEQARGTTVDARTDLWSLGCVLFELIAGRRPFEGTTTTDTLIAIVEKDPPPLSALEPRVAPECEWIITKTLRKKPEERYQNASDLLADLRRLQQTLDTGEHRSPSEATAVPQLASRRWRRPALTIAAGMIVILIGGATSWYGVLSPTTVEARSLAVLPLKSLTASDDYLGLGIADAVIRKTSQAGGLIVRPTSAVRRYASGDTDALTAARELSTDTVLEGSVQRAGDQLRVSVNLLRVHDGASIWADSFDMRMTDIFAIQDTVAQQVASHLRRTLDRSQQARREAHQTANPLAYEFYLKGMQLFDQRIGSTTAQKASMVDFFTKATELDPGFAAAHAQLGYALAVMAVFRQVPDDPAVAERARTEIERARSIDPDLPEIALARYQLLASRFEGFQLAEAVRVVFGAQRVDPTVGHGELAYLYGHMGLADLAERELQRALEVDPTSAFARQLTLDLYDWGSARYDKWLETHQRFEPSAPIDPWYYLATGRLDEAERELDRVSSERPSELGAKLGVLPALRGEARAAEQAIPSLLALHPVKDPFYHHTSLAIAQIYGINGKAADAVKWLREAEATGFYPYPNYERSPFFNRIRQSKEFVDFMTELKVKVDRYRREFDR